MDLGTMLKKVKLSLYSTVSQLKDDFDLMIDNCRKYNRPGTGDMYLAAAKDLESWGTELFAAVLDQSDQPTRKRTRMNKG
eukprot:SAG31_NODE_2327_length_5934_cov_7.878835_4_plen_80_part_00